jgi:hypothetical protein
VLPVSYNLMMMHDNLMMMGVMMRDDEKISIGRSGLIQPILRPHLKLSAYPTIEIHVSHRYRNNPRASW